MKVVSAEFIKSATEPSQYPEGELPEVAFVGRSNVGKSSLINAITFRKNLALTSSTPGCTRLINFFKVNDQISLADLPGYGYAKVPVASRRAWQPMIETYFKRRKSLKTVVLILDVRRYPSEKDIDLIHWLRKYKIIPIIILTKTDKISKSQAKLRQHQVKEVLGLTTDPILFSTRTGEGKDTIWGAIQNSLAAENPHFIQ
ncbi:MAG TPA: ribosome biogenesis GTP-binding protein YihA/YsxC [Syntrophales bacterium]|nr:ribosome biogenesis GTP-binding protein YihA/YsxC [Syntrophales bacterium]